MADLRFSTYARGPDGLADLQAVNNGEPSTSDVNNNITGADGSSLYPARGNHEEPPVALWSVQYSSPAESMLQGCVVAEPDFSATNTELYTSEQGGSSNHAACAAPLYSLDDFNNPLQAEDTVYPADYSPDNVSGNSGSNETLDSGYNSQLFTSQQVSVPEFPPLVHTPSTTELPSGHAPIFQAVAGPDMLQNPNFPFESAQPQWPLPARSNQWIPSAHAAAFTDGVAALNFDRRNYGDYSVLTPDPAQSSIQGFISVIDGHVETGLGHRIMVQPSHRTVDEWQ
jgi:hypothetical protein